MVVEARQAALMLGLDFLSILSARQLRRDQFHSTRLLELVICVYIVR
jgi:hypothetical protein